MSAINNTLAALRARAAADNDAIVGTVSNANNLTSLAALRSYLDRTGIPMRLRLLVTRDDDGVITAVERDPDSAAPLFECHGLVLALQSKKGQGVKPVQILTAACTVIDDKVYPVGGINDLEDFVGFMSAVADGSYKVPAEDAATPAAKGSRIFLPFNEMLHDTVEAVPGTGQYTFKTAEGRGTGKLTINAEEAAGLLESIVEGTGLNGDQRKWVSNYGNKTSTRLAEAWAGSTKKVLGVFGRRPGRGEVE
jgi:hypothetical protein